MTDHDPIDVHLETRDPQPTVAVRIQPAWDDLDVGALFGEHLGRIAEALGPAGVGPSGPPSVRYYAFGPDGVDMEIAFPVAEAVVPGLSAIADQPPGTVGTSALPGGELAVAVHRGPYPELGNAYRAVEAWIGANGRQPAIGAWETYLDSPMDTPAADLRTELAWPLAD